VKCARRGVEWVVETRAMKIVWTLRFTIWGEWWSFKQEGEGQDYESERDIEKRRRKRRTEKRRMIIIPQNLYYGVSGL